MKRAVLLAGLALASCASVEVAERDFASASVASDFDSYRLRRVGLVPFRGESISLEDAQELRSALFAEIESTSPFEVVPLEGDDLAEIPNSDPYRRGAYKPRTIIEIARRYRLDAILVGTVTDRQPFAPQRIGLQLDMVAAETGMVIWDASVHLDAGREDVREQLRLWSELSQGELSSDEWKLILISPRRFARFASYQLGKALR